MARRSFRPAKPAVLHRMVLLLTLSLSAGCTCSSSEPAAPPPAAAAAPATPAPAPPEHAEVVLDDTAYGRELSAQNAHTEALARAATQYANDWGRLERLSHAYEQRAGLTGDYADYVRAQETLDRAFDLAPEGAGPFLSRAHLHYTLHRLGPASEALDAADGARLMTPATRNAISSLRGDIAFHRGEIEEAERRHRATDEAQPSGSSAFRVAYDLWQTAHFEEAERWLEIAESRTPASDGRTRAWMSLQMGLMDLDRGRYEDALAHYQEADTRFDGWWLVHEHIAEIEVLLGHLDEAERRYRDVVERTDNPELIVALADLLEQREQPDEAQTFRARADARFEEQLEQLPEAAYGHALEHFLEHGTPERALELAEANYRMRPGGEATVRLARALLRADRAADARARLEPLLETPYRTAELHVTMAQVARATGDEALAVAQEQLAVAIHPTILE